MLSYGPEEMQEMYDQNGGYAHMRYQTPESARQKASALGELLKRHPEAEVEGKYGKETHQTWRYSKTHEERYRSLGEAFGYIHRHCRVKPEEELGAQCIPEATGADIAQPAEVACLAPQRNIGCCSALKHMFF